MIKYIPSKQFTFTLFAIYDKKNDNNMNKGKIVKGKVTSSKIQKNPNKVNNNSSKQTFSSINNYPDSDIIESPMKIKNCLKKYKNKNDKNNDNQSKALNNDSKRDSIDFINYISSKDYNNSRYEKKLSNISKLKNDLINNQYNKRKKRNESVDDIDINNSPNKNSKKNIKRRSLLELLKKKGIIQKKNDSKTNDELNELKKKSSKFAKNQNDYSENDEDNSELEINNDEANFKVYNHKNDLKKIYKDKKWELEPSNESALFLNDEKSDVKNIYKIKGDSKKIVKNPKNGIKDDRNNEQEEYNNSDFSNNNRQNNDEDNFITYKTVNKNYHSNHRKLSSRDRLYELFYNRDKNQIIRPYSIESRKQERKKTARLSENLYEYSQIKEFRRRNRKGRTYAGRGKEITSEDEERNIKKVKAVKAKIKKFISRKERPDIYYYDENPKNLHEYYNSINDRNNSRKISDNKIRKMNKSNSDKRNTKKNHHNRINSDNEYVDEEVEEDEEDENEDEDEEDYYNNNKQSKTIPVKKINHNKNNRKPQKIIIRPYKGLPTRNPITELAKMKFYKTNNNIKKNENEPNLNKPKNTIARKLLNSIENLKNNPQKNNDKRHIKVNSVTISNPYSSKPKDNPFKDSGIDAVKSKFKLKLIEMNENLSDAIHYYNGPIDISCISCKNYEETIEDLIKKLNKNGYRLVRNKNYYYQFTNGLNAFLVEIVIIRNNLLYYLVIKDKK